MDVDLGVDSAGEPPYPLDEKWRPLGHRHWYRPVVDNTDVVVRIIVLHTNPATGRWCLGGVPLDVPQVLSGAFTHVWQVVALDPLHLEPSLVCWAPGSDGAECGDHGFIRGGIWQPA